MKHRLKIVVRIAVLAAAVMLLALPARYDNSVFGYLPVLLCVLLMAVSAVFLGVVRKGISVTGTGTDMRAVRGDTASVNLCLKNSTPLVCPKVTAQVFISDYFNTTEAASEAVFTVDSRCSVDFGFDVDMAHVGVYTAGVRDIRLFGLLGLHSVKLDAGHSISVTVLPQIKQAEDNLSDIHPTDSSNARKFLENDGFDYTGVREYVYGDSMKNIHWKLSAHTQTLMTEIRETGLQSDMTVVLDTVTEKYPAEVMLKVNDALVETAAALCNEAFAKEIDYRLIYADKDGTAAVITPRSTEDYVSLIKNIAPIRSNAKNDDAAALMAEEQKMRGQTANVVVCTSRITDEMLTALLAVHQQRRSPALLYILPPNADRNTREEAAARVRMLDEYGIYCEVVL